MRQGFSFSYYLCTPFSNNKTEPYDKNRNR